ncbi:uncharacterized protein [Nicotiana sylvestris]|uniref:uncharacterized protein isoform X3 n=1 Tax=Nicotiana sylvestris TaxID=4096 RepID=UPI00388CAAFD
MNQKVIIPWAKGKMLYSTLWLKADMDLVAERVGVTLGPKGRNVVFGNKYGPPKINMAKQFLKSTDPSGRSFGKCQE